MMFSLTVFLALTFQQTVDVGSFAERTFQKEGGFIGEDGTIYYVTEHFIHGWNERLEKVVEIEVQGYLIEGFYAEEQRILTTQFNLDGKLKTVILDFQGETLGELALFGTQFQKLNGQLYLFRMNLDPPYIHVPFPFQYQPIEIYETEDGFDFRDQGQPLYKFTSHLAKFSFNFKDSWGVYRDGMYYFVNEIEPKVFIATLAEALREQKEGASKPGNLPSQPLELEGFVPFTEPFNPGKTIYRADELEAIRWHHRSQRSQIVGFQAYGDGYLVAYDYPQCDENGECQEPLLALQTLDDQFQPIGEPTTVPGLLLGTIGTSAYILQFEKPLTAKKPQGPFHARILVLDSL